MWSVGIRPGIRAATSASSHVDRHCIQRHRRLVPGHDGRRARPPAVGTEAARAGSAAPTGGLDGANTGLVSCSVVVAARDEDTRLEETVRHLLAQRDVAVDVIVVDDRSMDRTGDILRRLASADARVQARRVESLPDGWLGKCHACHVGAGAATGEWILFTDADCWLKPDVIARALRVADREEADHITLTPGVAAGDPRRPGVASGVSVEAGGLDFGCESRSSERAPRSRRVQPGARIGLPRLRRL